MVSDTRDQTARDQAVTHLKKRRDFHAHLLVYVLVNAFLMVIWAVIGAHGFFWPIFSIAGWGIGPGHERVGRLLAARDHRGRHQARDRARGQAGLSGPPPQWRRMRPWGCQAKQSSTGTGSGPRGHHRTCRRQACPAGIRQKPKATSPRLAIVVGSLGIAVGIQPVACVLPRHR